MAKTAKRRVGDTGEEVACKYLAAKGYSVIERNYLKPWGEIDIVAERQNGPKGPKRLYFIEVKTVTRATVGGFRPEDNVHPAKMRRLHRAVQTYLLDHKVSHDTLWQIDLVCVYLNFDTHKAKVEVLENIIL